MAWNCADMERPVNKRMMFVFDLMCPGLGHIIEKRYFSGLAGLILFLGTVVVFCYYTIVPFFDLLENLLNDGEIPETPFQLFPIIGSFLISVLIWIILLADGLIRK